MTLLNGRRAAAFLPSLRTVTGLVVLVLSTACHSSRTTNASVAAPTTVSVPPPTPAFVTFTGRLTATDGGNGLRDVDVDLGNLKTTTGPDGIFSYLYGTGGRTSRITFTSDRIVSRSMIVTTSATRTFDADAIVLDSQFDLSYYRQLVRDNSDGSTIRSLRRWTRTPSFYLKTVDEAGEAIHGPTLDVIEATLRDAVPHWTSGALGTPTIVRGTDTREGVSGWITVKFPAGNGLIEGRYCGRAQIAVDGGWIELGYHVPPSSAGYCRVPGYVIAPHVVRHEVGHALGFFHTSTREDLMYKEGSWWNGDRPTSRERYHAAIAYRRPVGNADPDSDPSSLVQLQPLIVH